jgi:hypothetical protein
VFGHVLTSPGTVAQQRDELLRHFDLQFIDIAPRPALARLVRRHHRVLRLVKVPRGVAPRRAIAAADVPTSQAEPKVNPAGPQGETLFTPFAAGRNRFKISQVFTLHVELPMV